MMTIAQMSLLRRRRAQAPARAWSFACRRAEGPRRFPSEVLRGIRCPADRGRV